jgi:hypothetical protein
VIRLAQRGATLTALALVFLYLTLGIAASACLFAPAAAAPPTHPQHHQHHHGGGPAHSTLCAWACQVNPAQGLISAAPTLTPQLLTPVVLLAFLSLPMTRGGLSLRSRAPPR